MRDFKGMKRQRGRNRGGGGGQGGGGKPQQNANRAFDSNGPENIKVRGHAQHVYEKYQQLARDATSSGDRVLAENFLQHAEHYFRVLRTLQPNRPISDFVARDTFASGYDIDFEDESGAQALPEEQPAEVAQAEGQGEGGEQQSRGEYQPRENREPRQDRWENRGDRPRDDRPREDRQRDGQQGGQREGRDRDRNRFDRDRDRNREDRGNRAEGEGGEQPREARGDRDGYRDRDRDRGYRDDRGPREDRAPREDGAPREDRPPRRERTYEPRAERADPLAVVEPQAEPLTQAGPAEVEAAPKPARVLRSRDGETSHAPAFLQAADAPAPVADGEEAPAKRTRGRPRKVKEEVAADEG